MVQAFQSRFRDPLLNYVHEGMLVFDRNGKAVGLVTLVQFGEEDADPITEFPNQDELLFKNDEEVIDEIEARLLRTGYVRVDSGLFVSDRFATPSQIALVTNDRIELNIPESDLISL